jgi:ribosomal protein L37AE/L43A
MTERLRTCCSICGSLSIRKVKSLRIYRCTFCNQSFVTPSSKLVESYSTSLRLGAVLRETGKMS